MKKINKELIPYFIIIVLCLTGAAIITISNDPAAFAQLFQ